MFVEHDINEILGLSNDELAEQARLIDRGVRPMTLFSPFDSDSDLMLRVATRLETLSANTSSVSFVIDRGNGFADCGFAAHIWVVETFRWIGEQANNSPYRSRILGLLLGYSATAIQNFEQQKNVRWFTLSLEPASR